MNINRNHWAYKVQDRECLRGQIRRHIKENNLPGWETISNHLGDNNYTFKIVKFEGGLVFEGKTYNVLFLEAWHYDDFELDCVECLFSNIVENALTKYNVSIAVDGRIDIPVWSDSFESAKEKALEEFASANIGDLECVDFHAVNAESDTGEFIDF